LPTEVSILTAGVKLSRQGVEHFHGFMIAREVQGLEGGRLLSHGSLYRALHRLEQAELLTSWWEDPELAERERRPRRRLYSVTGVGVEMLKGALKLQVPGKPQLRLRPAT